MKVWAYGSRIIYICFIYVGFVHSEFMMVLFILNFEIQAYNLDNKIQIYVLVLFFFQFVNTLFDYNVIFIVWL